ncbi:MAG: electron transfer flavoprotein subunit beta, partial [bacterium]|nr:electron transfer flavoprotein subunit beta [bacterium]
TLSQGIQLLGGADLILCGRQTTDGDTAQIGPAIAEHLHLPHAAWVNAIVRVSDTCIRVRQRKASLDVYNTR